MRTFGILLSFLLVGCATSTPQADALLTKVYDGPSSHVIEGVPFVKQSAGHCGPATLTMALQWAGRNISVDELAPQVYTPGMKGSLQSDMISATRRQGMMAIPIEGFEALLVELRANHPVIVFENLSLSWLPQWHYALVFGYDLRNQKVLMHSGPEAFKNWDLRKFERSWSLAGYWGLVILRPDQLSASADELAHIGAAAGLEQVGHLEAAKRSYQEILKRWPKSLLAQLGLGNIAYSQMDFVRARQILKKAKMDHPTSAIAWHNSAFAEGAAGNKSEARRSAVEALRWVSAGSRPYYLDSLKEWLQE